MIQKQIGQHLNQPTEAMENEHQPHFVLKRNMNILNLVFMLYGRLMKGSLLPKKCALEDGQ